MASAQPKSAHREAGQQEPARLAAPKIHHVGEGRFPKVKLVKPTQSGYILIAAEVDHRLAFLPNSRKKRQLIADCKELCRQVAQDPTVLEAVVFDAIFIPPGGEGKKFLEQHRPGVRFPRYDLSVLIETTSPETADALEDSVLYERLERTIRTSSPTSAPTTSPRERSSTASRNRHVTTFVGDPSMTMRGPRLLRSGIPRSSARDRSSGSCVRVRR
jgi:hypothetical protein